MNIEEYLKRNGPGLSSTIKHELVGSGVSEQAARQRLSRAGKHIKRLKGNLLPRREAFLYLESQKDTRVFFENLVNALKFTNSVNFYAIAALASHGGSASLDKFRVLSGAPTMRKKQTNFDKMLAGLAQNRLVFKKQIAGVETIELNSSLLASKIVPRVEWNHSYEVLEELMTLAMENWLRTNGLGSYNKIKRNGEFNSYYWDLTAPSYTHPFFERGNPPKPGFITVDIFPQYDIEKNWIQYFVKKFEATRSQYKAGRFFPILLGNSFDSSAFEFGKKSGFLITTPGNFLGSEIEKLLSDLKNTLENMAAAAKNKSQDEIASMVRAVAKIEGKSNNIRGHLFELVVAHIITNEYPGIPEVRKKVKDSREEADIDVFCQDGKKAIRCYECKGNNARQTITRETIERWEGKTQVVRNWLEKTELRNRKQYFEFWTTSTFEPDALTYLKEMKKKAKKFHIEYKARTDVIQAAKDGQLNSICNLLKEHYGGN